MSLINNVSNVHLILDNVIDNFIEPNFVCVDGTLGNGKDALKIINKLDKTGKFYGFDIQDLAIENSKTVLNNKKFKDFNINLIQDTHSNVANYIKEKVDFFILNLGYLPGGNKEITTKSESLIEFLKKITDKMGKNAVGIIVFYPGHPSGLDELERVGLYLTELNQKDFNVLQLKFLNQINNPPQIAIIERI